MEKANSIPVLFKKAKSTKEKNNKKSNYLFIVLGFIVVLLLCNDPTLTTSLATNTGSCFLKVKEVNFFFIHFQENVC